MDKLILENVRCFSGRHELPLAPLTILVGENSTGKSTVLSAVRLAADICRIVGTPDFNEEPFDWGAYDQIACTRGGRGGGAQPFGIGREFDNIPDYEQKVVRIGARFVEKNAHPELFQWRIDVDEDSAIIELAGNGNATIAVMVGGKKVRQSSLKWDPAFQDAFYVLFWALRKSDAYDVMQRRFFSWESFLDRVLVQRNRPYAFAPIRTRPRRTYDRRADTPHPEGEHIPMVLARLKTSAPKQWKELKTELTEFGRECGLFKSVDVKSFDKKSGPFQVQIVVNGSPSNMVDVGYGVSQVLPLLVDCLEETNQLLLIQQPEVHLHPRAQAQIGSFFGYLVRKHEKRFIVETHSDYLVDRIRMDVRDGKHGLRPEDVSILYFERKDAAVTVHAMRIDQCGNLLDAPPGYRQFFLEEEKKFIGG
jgi:hypothetical protein